MAKTIPAPIYGNLPGTWAYSTVTRRLPEIAGRVIHENQFPDKINLSISNLQQEIHQGEIAMLINTPTRKGRGSDEGEIRSAAVRHEIPIYTTMTGARAVVRAIRALKESGWSVKPIQTYHG